MEELEQHLMKDLKTLLANEATILLHGKAAALKASETAKKTLKTIKILRNLAQNLP